MLRTFKIFIFIKMIVSTALLGLDIKNTKIVTDSK